VWLQRTLFVQLKTLSRRRRQLPFKKGSLAGRIFLSRCVENARRPRRSACAFLLAGKKYPSPRRKFVRKIKPSGSRVFLYIELCQIRQTFFPAPRAPPAPPLAAAWGGGQGAAAAARFFSRRLKRAGRLLRCGKFLLPLISLKKFLKYFFCNRYCDFKCGIITLRNNEVVHIPERNTIMANRAKARDAKLRGLRGNLWQPDRRYFGHP